jgi:hypothetical protein
MKRILLITATALCLMLSVWAQGGSGAQTAPSASRPATAGPSQTDNKGVRDSSAAGMRHHHRRHHRHHRRRHHS